MMLKCGVFFLQVHSWLWRDSGGSWLKRSKAASGSEQAIAKHSRRFVQLTCFDRMLLSFFWLLSQSQSPELWWWDFFKFMHQIQSPTSFAEAHGVFAPLQIHTRRGKCMFKHHTGSTGGCKSMPTTSRQQKVMPKAGLNRVMLTLHALAETCWKLWRCLLTEKWHAYKLPQENTERWYVDTHSLQFYFRISNMYLLSLLSLFAFMRKHTTYLKKIIYTLTSLYL